MRAAYHRAVADHGPLGLRGDLARDAIVQACTSGLAERQLFEQVAARLRPVVPYAAAGWLSTDPATLLYTDAVVDGLGSDLHLQFFENELVEPDFAKFADILRGPQPSRCSPRRHAGSPSAAPAIARFTVHSGSAASCVLCSPPVAPAGE